MTIADHQPQDGQPCDGCPVATGRRAFLRDAGIAAAAAIAAITIGRPALAFAQSVTEIAPIAGSTGPMERAYTIPSTDSVAVDVPNEVILARWEGHMYAFSLKCPHKGARLEWRNDEERVYCPKHKARFTAAGSHVSGRGSRDLDRYAIRRGGTGIVVDFGQVYRSDTDRDAWNRAVVSV